MGQRVAGGIEFDIANEELANSANITPYTTSRIIGEWAENRRDPQKPREDSCALS